MFDTHTAQKAIALPLLMTKRKCYTFYLMYEHNILWLTLSVDTTTTTTSSSSSNNNKKLQKKKKNISSVWRQGEFILLTIAVGIVFLLKIINQSNEIQIFSTVNKIIYNNERKGKRIK